MLASDYSENANKIYCNSFLAGYNSYSVNNACLPWSRSIFSKEYLQVEVLASEEVLLEKSTDEVLNMNTYTCHICDIEVPKSHSTEHNNGEKHQTCVRIADLALERTRKYMSLKVKTSKLSIQVTETYFCEPCSIIVQNRDKAIHDLSEKHAKSMKYDEILKDFLMIYEDRENFDFESNKNCSDRIEFELPEGVDCESVSNESIVEATNKDEEIEKETKLQTENTETEVSFVFTAKTPQSEPIISDMVPEIPQPDPKLSETVPETSQSVPETLQTQLRLETKNSLDSLFDQLADSLKKHFSDQSNPPKKMKFEKQSKKPDSELANYLKTVSENYNKDGIHSVKAFSDKLILITAINGDKVKVPVVNFHSIHKQKDKSYCKICEDPNVGYHHEYSEEHMEKVMIPIEDKNAIRKIDDIWSHCVLCNDLTKNITFHLQSLLHRNKLKHCSVESGTDINQNDLKPLNPQNDAAQLIQEHSLIVSNDNTEITCNICNLTIQNTDTSIKNHVSMFDHVNSYNNTIEDNKLSEIDDTQFYCMPCDVCVNKCYALGHCNGKKHKKHLTDLIHKENAEECTQIILASISQQIKRQNKSKNTEFDLICFVCNIVLYNVDKHMNSLEHKRNYLSYLESNKLNEIEEDTFFCIPCNTVILIDYLMNHCTSKKHKIHLKKLLNPNQDIQNQSNVQIIAENSHISRSITQSVQNAKSLKNQPATSQNGIFDTAIPLKFLYQFREMSNSRNLLCTVCDEEIPFRKYDVQSHVNLIDHVVAFNLMMLWNKIKRLNDRYYCDICKVEVTYFNELAHITSAAHVSVMAKLTKCTVYEYDKKLLTLEYAMSHKVGDRVRPTSIISVVKPKDN